MVPRTLITAALLAGCTICTYGQNFSGLQYKRLSRAEDLGTMLESLLGRIGGSVDGSIDSVVVAGDYEQELHLRIYYTDLINGYFTVSTMNRGRGREPQVEVVRFKQSERSSPAECILKLNPAAAKEAFSESPYLRIDVSKRADGGGKVKVFALQKKWVMPGGVAAPNMQIRAVLQPVGVAASLNPNADNGVMPAKKIQFNKAILDTRDGRMKPVPVRTTGGNSAPIRLPFLDPVRFADISGTWLNTNKTAPGITKLVVTNNNYIRVFSKSSSQSAEYESAKGPLSAISATQFRAQFIVDNKLETAQTTGVLDLNLVNNQLQAKYTTKVKMAFNVISKSYNYTFQKQALPVKPFPGVVTLEEFKNKLPDRKPVGPPSTEAQGAGDETISIWDGIAVDNLVDFKNPQDISSINIAVIPDKNPNSGIYYIMPADFHLLWDPSVKSKMGYGLSISYGKQTGETEEDQDAPVRMSAMLTAGISNQERNFVRSLLRGIDPKFREIKDLPLRENLETSFPANLSALYNIPADKIAVTAGSDFNKTITVAWRTDADTKEFIQTALTTGEGIAAAVVLKPRNEQLPDYEVPALISLSDNSSFGKMNLDPKTWRSREWINETAYPLKLKYLHVLKKSLNGNTPIVYSWSMENAEIPSRARVSFDNSRVPVWLDNDPTAVMWLDYSVMDCSPCHDSVIVAITDGVPANLAQQIRVNIPPAVFDTMKAQQFLVTLRSRQADPKGGTVTELPAVYITREPGKNFFIGPLFIHKGGTPEYEFNVKIETLSGDFIISEQWLPATEKELLLGTSRMKAIFKGTITDLEQ